MLKNNISKIIHQIWFQGKENIPDKYISNIQKIKKNHPKWSYQIWDDKELRKECRKYSIECLKKYDSYKHLHQKVDLGRYVLLYNYGGAYIDIDCISLKPLEALPGFKTKKLIISYNPCNYLENMISTLSLNIKIINNGVILSSSKNKYMKKIINGVISTNTCRFPKNKSLCIQDTTGPLQFTKTVSSFKDDINVLILDCSYFEPCYGKDPYCKPTKNSYIDHKHEASWLDSNLINLMPIYFFIKHNFIILLILIIIFGLFVRQRLQK